MEGKISGIALTAIGSGGLLVYAGITGKDIPAAITAIIRGKSPATAPGKYKITGGGGRGTSSASPAGYVNPFGQIQNLSPGRVDMGVDFGGAGLIVAIGSGKITETINLGWPGSAFICIHLDSGAYAGKYAYFAENISPSVKTGQHVNAGDVIGIMTGSIECGWAAPPGVGATMAAINLQFGGINTTAYGASFNRWLMSLGVPSGQINNTPTGTVGAGYP